MGVYTAPRANILTAGSAVVSLWAAGGGVSGTWYELTASSSATYLVIGMAAGSNGGIGRVTLSLGIGAAGAEATVASVTFSTGTYSYGYGNLTFARPIKIPSGTRIAVKADATNTGPRVMYAPEASVA